PPKLRADPFPLLVQPHTTPAWLFGVLGALSFLLLAFAVVLIYRKRQRPVLKDVPKEILDLPKIHAHMHAAKQYRVNGDLYGVYRELAAAARRINPEAPLAQTLKRRADDVGYRGLKPNDDQVEGDFRDLERRLAQEQPTGDS
ncbi:MAG: hypothetical protein IT364_15825, partial [Candidatus Hydrogenedentes bacterium]|nr:hypothetical protein [Candidatus Hydrogenedentota bacterium]